MSEIFANIHDAKTNLSKLLQRVEAGDEVVISRAGKPVARLLAIRPAQKRERKKPLRQPGSMKDLLWLADDWDSPETNALIAGDPDAPLFPPRRKK